MGAILSKRKADKAKKVAREKAGFHPKRIYFDEDGNLKHGTFNEKCKSVCFCFDVCMC